MKVLHAVVCGICLLWLAGRDDMTSDGCLGFVCLLLLFVLFWGFLWGFLFFLFLEGGGGGVKPHVCGLHDNYLCRRVM